MQESEIVKKLLERLVETEFNDDDVMLKLLSIYSKAKDYRKIKFMYNLYLKRLKTDFNIQPSEELKNFYEEVFSGS